MARAWACSIFANELEKGEVLLFPGRRTRRASTARWRVPFNPEPPYTAPNHLGMAYATLMTADLVSDYALLKKQGLSLSAQLEPLCIHA